MEGLLQPYFIIIIVMFSNAFGVGAAGGFWFLSVVKLVLGNRNLGSPYWKCYVGAWKYFEH